MSTASVTAEKASLGQRLLTLVWVLLTLFSFLIAPIVGLFYRMGKRSDQQEPYTPEVHDPNLAQMVYAPELLGQ